MRIAGVAMLRKRGVVKTHYWLSFSPRRFVSFFSPRREPVGDEGCDRNGLRGCGLASPEVGEETEELAGGEGGGRRGGRETRSHGEGLSRQVRLSFSLGLEHREKETERGERGLYGCESKG